MGALPATEPGPGCCPQCRGRSEAVRAGASLRLLKGGQSSLSTRPHRYHIQGAALSAPGHPGAPGNLGSEFLATLLWGSRVSRVPAGLCGPPLLPLGLDHPSVLLLAPTPHLGLWWGPLTQVRIQQSSSCQEGGHEEDSPRPQGSQTPPQESRQRPLCWAPPGSHPLGVRPCSPPSALDWGPHLVSCDCQH